MTETAAAARARQDRHIVEQLKEVAHEEGYEALKFTITETPQKDGPSKRRIVLTIERELDELESIL